MNVLLLSMPDSFEHMPSIAIRLPNGALGSLAGNVDEHHHVAAADLILAQSDVGRTVTRLMADHAPDVVGLSIMTFQRRTAQRVMRLVRALKPDVRIVVGGYDPTLAPDAYTDSADGPEFIVRGEGEITLRELLRAIERRNGYDDIIGLSFRDGAEYRHNPDRPPANLNAGDIQPPRRASRVLDGYTLLGRRVDVVETSRGCTFDCGFCSII